MEFKNLPRFFYKTYLFNSLNFNVKASPKNKFEIYGGRK